MSGPVLIVGAGQAAYACAVGLRKLMPDQTVTIIGDEPHAPYERPPLSKDCLLEETPSGIQAFLPEEAYAERGITLLTGTRVTEIDRSKKTVTLADGTGLSYERLVLTTGGRARPLPVPGGDMAHLLRSHDDALALREKLKPGNRLIIAGAGVIGLELAASALKLGCTVTVIEREERVMARALPAPESGLLEARHSAEGVDLRLNTQLTGLEADGERIVARCSDGSSVTGDLVAAGIGIIRNSELAAAAGLECGAGIRVDAFGRTADPAIFAAGDVAEIVIDGRSLLFESYHAALDQGSALAKTLSGDPAPFPATPRFWSDQYDMRLQCAGDWRAAVSVIEEGEASGPRHALYLDEENRPVFAIAVNQPRLTRKMLKMIEARAPIDAEAARPLVCAREPA